MAYVQMYENDTGVIEKENINNVIFHLVYLKGRSCAYICLKSLLLIFRPAESPSITAFCSGVLIIMTLSPHQSDRCPLY